MPHIQTQSPKIDWRGYALPRKQNRSLYRFELITHHQRIYADSFDDLLVELGINGTEDRHLFASETHQILQAKYPGETIYLDATSSERLIVSLCQTGYWSLSILDNEQASENPLHSIASFQPYNAITGSGIQCGKEVIKVFWQHILLDMCPFVEGQRKVDELFPSISYWFYQKPWVNRIRLDNNLLWYGNVDCPSEWNLNGDVLTFHLPPLISVKHRDIIRVIASFILSSATQQWYTITNLQKPINKIQLPSTLILCVIEEDSYCLLREHRLTHADFTDLGIVGA